MKSERAISRRHLLLGAAGLLSGASGLLHPRPAAAWKPSTSDRTPRVTCSWIARGEESAAYGLFRRAVEAATDFSWLARNDRVLVKVALNSGRPYPATSDPWAVAALVRLLKEKGAGRVLVGDSSGCRHVRWTAHGRRGSSRACCASAGLLSVIEQSGAVPRFFEEDGPDGFVPAWPGDGHHWGAPVWIARAVTEVDHVVYLPRIGSHILGDASLGLKIGVGFLREDSRRRLHESGRDFHALYSEINRIPEIAARLRLVVSTGREVLAFGGPDAGPVARPDHGPVIVSTDLVAHELLACGWLQWCRRMEVPLAVRAAEELAMRGRSARNRRFVTENWQLAGTSVVADLDPFRPGRPVDHPAVQAFLATAAGWPGRVDWEQVNEIRDVSIPRFLESRLAGS